MEATPEAQQKRIYIPHPEISLEALSEPLSFCLESSVILCTWNVPEVERDVADGRGA